MKEPRAIAWKLRKKSMDAWYRWAGVAGVSVLLFLVLNWPARAQPPVSSLAAADGAQKPSAESAPEAAPAAHGLLQGLGEDATGPDDAAPEEEAEAEGRLPALSRRMRPLLVPENPRIDSAQRYFLTRQRSVMEAGYRRAGRYMPLIRAVLAEEGLPPQLAYLAALESNFDPLARSPAHAVGLWQFMDDTARRYGLRVSQPWYDERLDPVYSTRAAARLLGILYDRFGSWDMALAAYNAGDGRIRRAIRRAGQPPGGQDFWSLRRLPRETKGYVPAFYALLRIYENPWTHGLASVEQEPQLKLEAVVLDFPASLADLAQRLDVPAHLLRGLNPAWKRGFMPPTATDPVLLHVPAGHGQRAANVLAANPPALVRWRTHKVARGESLAEIARGYGISERELTDMNRVRKPGRPAAGQELLLPLPASVASVQAAEPAANGGVRAVHRVRPGETLAAIARLYGVSPGSLRQWNDLEGGGVAPGLELVVVLPQ
jgi:membrane-bound lytic murein transglycosylase D